MHDAQSDSPLPNSQAAALAVLNAFEQGEREHRKKSMAPINDELIRLSKLIDLIYEGATDPSRWMKDILPAIAEYIQAPQAYLFSSIHPPQAGGYFFYHGISQEYADRYTNKYLTEDMWAAAAIEKNLAFEGNVILGDELLPREQWMASKAYTEYFDHDENMAQMMAGVVFGLDSDTAMPSHCSFFRGTHHPDFAGEDRDRLRLVLPHLSRALGVMQRLQSAELTLATSKSALDRLPTGVLLLDRSGAVAFANRAAQRILEHADGLQLRKRPHATGPGDLVSENAHTTDAIRAAIHEASIRSPYDTSHFSTCLTVPRPTSLGSYSMQFSALGNHNEFSGSDSSFSTIVFIADNAINVAIDPEVLQRGYGLTPAEAKAAVALLDLASVKEVAEVLDVSPHTVRTQMKQVYAKLGVDTRTRFVKTMLGLASLRS